MNVRQRQQRGEILRGLWRFEHDISQTKFPGPLNETFFRRSFAYQQEQTIRLVVLQRPGGFQHHLEPLLLPHASGIQNNLAIGAQAPFLPKGTPTDAWPDPVGIHPVGKDRGPTFGDAERGKSSHHLPRDAGDAVEPPHQPSFDRVDDTF